MLKLSDHLYIPPMGRIIEEKKAARPQRTGVQKRYYSAGKSSRLNADWSATPLTANLAMQQSLRSLRSRAREMATDNGHFKKYLAMCRSNIIGHKGIQLQCRARKSGSGSQLHSRLNKRIEEAFWEWTFRETCTVSGKLDWVAAQRLFVTTLARDGEVLVQHVRADNEFGYSLKFINVDHLDENYNEERANGNRIIMSVEVDDDDRPVAYWLTPPSTDVHPQRRKNRSVTRTRVAAEEIIHAFLVFDDESQVRGVTWFHSALLDAKHLHGYKEGVITSARMAANTFGFFEQQNPDEVEYQGEEDEDGNVTQLSIDSSPLSMNELPPGVKFTQFDPKQPTQNHAQFYKSMTMDVAAALDVHYFSLAGDMEAVNFSSARVGLTEERDVWRSLQDFVATVFCREVYHHWLDEAMLAGKLTLSTREYYEVRNPLWRPRSWEYIDPQKETAATIAALENKLTSWTEVLNDRGVDIDDHFETLASEQERAARHGIDLKTVKMLETEPPAEGDDDEDAPPARREFTNGHGLELVNLA